MKTIVGRGWRLPYLGLAFFVMSGLVVADPPPEGKSRADEFRDYAQRTIAKYTIRPAAGGEPLALQPEPVLTWSNPIVGEIYGNVFIWTSKGRPEVVGSLHKWYSPHHHSAIEFLSLSTGQLVAHWNGSTAFWTPARPGIELKPIPEAPRPASTPSQRLRQIRELAKDFSGRERLYEETERETRLLAQPVYRYSDCQEPVIDGALFAFVQGTDPETFLLIEARRVDGKPQWRYALARMNHVAMRVSYRGKEIWAAPLLPFAQVQDRRAPYATLGVPE
jgi:hypothetical protein